jgi:hypothetical protein
MEARNDRSATAETPGAMLNKTEQLEREEEDEGEDEGEEEERKTKKNGHFRL